MSNPGTANIPAREWRDRLRQSAGDFYTLLRRVIWLAAVYGVWIASVTAQEPPLKAGVSYASASAKEDLSPAPAKVDVNPIARDEEIRQRLQSVLIATDWFTEPEVRVEEGVVFLKGRVASDELKKWAGDLVEVSGVIGYVQQLNVRTTILMTLDGNLVQIPNASVYKSNLRNFTANSNRREHFDIGIGYDDTINEAQEIALQILTDHPAVLNDPLPSVLADSLGKATVNLRVYFWINGRKNSWLKVRSSVIRMVKRAFQKHGISMSDEAREVVFPQGIPITMVDGKPTGSPDAKAEEQLPANWPFEELDVVSTKAEGGLQSEAGVLDQQARHAQLLREGDNLLPNAPDNSFSKEPARNLPAKSNSTRSS